MAVRRVAPLVGVKVIACKSTVGKMKLFRKVARDEVVDFADVIGVGRMATPIPSTRRI